MGDPVRFVRKLAGIFENAYNRVQLEDAAGNVIDSANPLPTSASGTSSSVGLVSTNNSTTALLGISGVFTGVGDDVKDFASVSVSYSSDVANLDETGLQMQFSTDNVNWDTVNNAHSHTGTPQVNQGGIHRFPVSGNFFRVVYTNGVLAQTVFRLQTLFHSDNSFPLTNRIEQQIDTTSDLALSRPATDIQLDLARRQITGQRTFFFFGFNNKIDAAVWEDIHPNGGDINWLTIATKVEVLSSNAADTAAGLGTRSVELHGLSATGEDQDEVINMNGVTPVESALTYIRVNKLHNEEVGTYGGSHQGDVTCRVTSAGATLAVMTGREGAVNSSVQYGLGEAGNGFYSVPLGKVLYITGGSFATNTSGTKTADIVLYEREGILVTSASMLPRRVLFDAIEIQGTDNFVIRSHIKIKPLTDIWFRAQASNNDTKIETFLEFYLVNANAAGE